MIRNELVSRSPLRILERSTKGGVGKGNIGIIAGKKGIGKTACLVHIATDQLLQEKHVIHVSYAANTNHIIVWYEDIFNELTRRNTLDSAMDVHDDMIKNRVIMNFRQNGVSSSQIEHSIRSMIQDGHFRADVIVVDGYDFSIATPEDFHNYKKLASEMGIEIWFSASLNPDTTTYNQKGMPNILESFTDDIAILVCLEQHADAVHLRLIKDHDIYPASDNLHLKLDPQILLIAEEN